MKKSAIAKSKMKNSSETVAIEHLNDEIIH